MPAKTKKTAKKTLKAVKKEDSALKEPSNVNPTRGNPLQLIEPSPHVDRDVPKLDDFVPGFKFLMVTPNFQEGVPVPGCRVEKLSVIEEYIGGFYYISTYSPIDGELITNYSTPIEVTNNDALKLYIEHNQVRHLHDRESNENLEKQKVHLKAVRDIKKRLGVDKKPVEQSDLQEESNKLLSKIVELLDGKRPHVAAFDEDPKGLIPKGLK